jgi:hypothetical protein
MVGGRDVLQALEPRVDTLASSFDQTVGEYKQSRGARRRNGVGALQLARYSA